MSRRAKIGGALLFGLWLASAPLRAEPVAKARPAEAPAQAGTLASLAIQLGQRLTITEPVLVVVGPVLGDASAAVERVQLQARTSLHERIRLVVGSAVTSAASRSTQALSLPEARAEARKRGLPLVYLAPTLRAGQLDLTVDWIGWPSSFWQRTRLPEGLVTSHLSLSAPADAEVRSFLPRPRGLLSRKQSFPSPLRDVVALSCGMDTEGAVSLLVVGRRELLRGRFVGPKFAVEHRRSWAELSPLAAAPLRAPLAAAHFRAAGIDVGSSDRAYLVRLDGQLQLIARAPRALPLLDGGCAPFSDSGVVAGAFSCDFGAPIPANATQPVSGDPASLSARVEGRFSNASGVSTTIQLLQPSGSSTAQLRVRSPLRADAQWSLEQTGSAVAIADVDGDGSAEIVSSSASRTPPADVLRVHGWQGNDFAERHRVTLPGVRALTICPFAGENPLLIVVATDDRLWLIS